MLTALGIPAVAHGNVIEISAGLVGIDEACSGIRSLQATLMIALFFGELYRLPVTRRVWLVLAGIALAFVCNMARTFVLVWVSSRSGLGALDRWHDPTGIAILLVCFSGLWAVANRLRPKATASPQTANSARWPRPFPRFVPAAVLIWLVLVEGGTAAWFGVHEKADPRRLNWSVRWPTDKPDLHKVDLGRQVTEEMKFKEGKSMSWRDRDGRAWQTFYFRWGPANNLLERVRVQFAKTHRPEICLPAAGLALRDDYGVKDFAIGGLTLPFRAYYFEDRGRPLHVYFCAWEDGTHGIAANMRENAATRLAAARTGSRSISQRVLEIAVWGFSDSNQADAALQRELTELIQN
jgi:exosortase/archaeosortase family protein